MKLDPTEDNLLCFYLSPNLALPQPPPRSISLGVCNSETMRRANKSLFHFWPKFLNAPPQPSLNSHRTSSRSPPCDWQICARGGSSRAHAAFFNLRVLHFAWVWIIHGPQLLAARVATTRPRAWARRVKWAVSSICLWSLHPLIGFSFFFFFFFSFLFFGLHRELPSHDGTLSFHLL